MRSLKPTRNQHSIHWNRFDSHTLNTKPLERLAQNLVYRINQRLPMETGLHPPLRHFRQLSSYFRSCRPLVSWKIMGYDKKALRQLIRRVHIQVSEVEYSLGFIGNEVRLKYRRLYS